MTVCVGLFNNQDTSSLKMVRPWVTIQVPNVFSCSRVTTETEQKVLFVVIAARVHGKGRCGDDGGTMGEPEK